MGLLDNLLKTIEDGGIEKTLENALDKLDSGLEQVTASAEKLAEAPEKVMNRAGNLSAQTAKAVDAITKPGV